MQNPPPGYHRVSPYLLYEDAPRAIGYLTRTFGFRERLSQKGAAGRTHTELVIGEDGLVMLGQASEAFRSPRSLGVDPSVLIHVYVEDVEALREHAREADGEVGDLELSPVGDYRFTATDPEGQVWVFSQRTAKPGR